MRFYYLLLPLLFSISQTFGATILIEVLHDEDVKIQVTDAALSNYVAYEPVFEFPEKTTFGLEERNFTLLQLSVDNEIYFLYVKGSYITIDFKNAKVRSDAFFLFKKRKDFFKKDVNGKWLLHLFQIEAFYARQLNRVDSLVKNDKSYGFTDNNTLYWNKKTAKKLLNNLNSHYTNEQDFKLKYSSPSYLKFAELIYNLSFKYSEKDINPSSSVEAQYQTIYKNALPGMAQAMVLHHFFRPSTPLVLMESANNAAVFDTLDAQIKYAAAKSIENRKANLLPSEILNASYKTAYDVDASLRNFFNERSRSRPTVIIFWTTFTYAMDFEFYQMRQLHNRYGDYFDFVYVCLNAFEEEQKARAIIKRERLHGTHLFPKTKDAYWKSSYKGNEISALPFYVITDVNNDVILAVDKPLDYDRRIAERMRTMRNAL